MTEYKRRVLMVYPYAIWKLQARHVMWDRIEELTPRSKTGDFTVAIQSLPNKMDQFTLFRDWLEELKGKEFIPQDTQIYVVSPFISEVYPRCYSTSGKRNKNRDHTKDYHTFHCKTCGHSGNRHSTAARVAALSMRKAMEGIPYRLPSIVRCFHYRRRSDGRGPSVQV